MDTPDTLHRNAAIAILKLDAAEAERGGWMLANASDIGAPTVESILAQYEDDEAFGDLLDRIEAALHG